MLIVRISAYIFLSLIVNYLMIRLFITIPHKRKTFPLSSAIIFNKIIMRMCCFNKLYLNNNYVRLHKNYFMSVCMPMPGEVRCTTVPAVTSANDDRIYHDGCRGNNFFL